MLCLWIWNRSFDIWWPLIIFQANTFIGSPASKINKLCSFQKQKLNFNVIQDLRAVVRKLTGKSDKQLFATLNLVNIRRLGIVSGSLTIELFPSSRSPKFFSFSMSGWISTISFHSKSRVHNLRNLDFLWYIYTTVFSSPEMSRKLKILVVWIRLYDR